MQAEDAKDNIQMSEKQREQVTSEQRIGDNLERDEKMEIGRNQSREEN